VLDAVLFTWLGVWTVLHLLAALRLVVVVARLDRALRRSLQNAADALSPPEGAQSVVSASTGGSDLSTRNPPSWGDERRRPDGR
jgi:hypothetical protein